MTPQPDLQMSAAAWHSTLPRGPGTAERDTAPFGIRRLIGTPALVSQPALSDDIVCMHLGGVKRVHRWHGGRASVHDVAENSITIMPRAIENRWRTIGPVDYLHIVLGRNQLEAVAAEEQSGDPARIELRDIVGTRHPLLEASVAEMHRLATQEVQPSRLQSDGLTTVFLVALLAISSSAPAVTLALQARRGGLGGWRMRRVTDYMQSRYASDIDLAELTELTELSRAHFYRAFRQSTGTTPARYLDAIRAERASALLAGDASLAEVAAAVGLRGTASLATIFRRHFGISPRDYRREVR